MPDASAPVPTAAFTLAELAHLAGWGRERGMEVWIDNEGADFADEVAYIGYGYGLSPWTVHRQDGELSLGVYYTKPDGVLADWCRPVVSVADALALILLNDPRD